MCCPGFLNNFGIIVEWVSGMEFTNFQKEKHKAYQST